MNTFVAVKSGYYFAVICTTLLSGVKLLSTGRVVLCNGNYYPLYKGAQWEDAQKIDNLIDDNGLSVFPINKDGGAK